VAISLVYLVFTSYIQAGLRECISYLFRPSVRSVGTINSRAPRVLGLCITEKHYLNTEYGVPLLIRSYHGMIYVWSRLYRAVFHI